MTAGTAPANWKARFTKYIRSTGGRVTRPRLCVAEVFFSMGGHPGVEELLVEVRSRHKGIGAATVYRTMKLLCDAGLVASRQFGEGFSRYETEGPEGHHDHLICTSCGKIVEFEDEAIEELQVRVSQRYDFIMERHRLDIFGICPTCQSEKRSRG